MSDLALWLLAAAALLLAGIALWRWLAKDRVGSIAAIVGAVSAAVAFVVGLFQRKDAQARAAEQAAEVQAEAARSARVNGELARIRVGEAEELGRIATAGEAERAKIQVEGVRSEEAGPAPGELEDVLEEYRRTKR